MFDQPFAIPALLFLVMALPLVLRLVPRNRFYGIRTRQALSDDGCWYEANRRGGLGVMLAGLIYLAVASVLPYDKADPRNFTTFAAHLAAFAGPLLLALLCGARCARKP